MRVDARPAIVLADLADDEQVQLIKGQSTHERLGLVEQMRFFGQNVIPNDERPAHLLNLPLAATWAGSS